MDRLSPFGLVGLALFGIVFYSHPEQVPVVLNKTASVLFPVWLGYWADRLTSPYARPDKLACAPAMPDSDIAFAAAMLRRAIIMGSVVVAYAMAL